MDFGKVKLNLNFYKGNDQYNDGDSENEVIRYIEQYGDNIEHIFPQDSRWPVYYHLSPIRKNILNWYPFRENSDILEIGAGMGAVTDVLCDKAKSVTAVELSKRRATAIALRNKDKANLEIIVGNLNDIHFEKKFDYITLIGVLEYAGRFTNTTNPYHDFLRNIKKLLKDDGKLLIAIENKFGMKYWAGAAEDHTNVMFDNITGYKNNIGIQTFGKLSLEKMFQEIGFSYSKFYYPLPDYKLPSVIFSDQSLPDYNTITKYIPFYYENTNTLFKEIDAYKEVIKENMFSFFANSFFIEIGNSGDHKKENDVKAAMFNPYRKNKYSVITLIKEGFVEKQASNLSSQTHIDNIDKAIQFCSLKNIKLLDTYNKKTVESKLINSNTLDNSIRANIVNGNIEDAYSQIEKYFNYLKGISEKIQHDEKTIFEEFNAAIKDDSKIKSEDFLKVGLFDLIFQNCFEIDEEYVFFDQEWISEPAPIKFILFRAIMNLFSMQDPMRSKLDFYKIFSRYDILPYLEDFLNLENKIQNNIHHTFLNGITARHSGYLLSNEQSSFNNVKKK